MLENWRSILREGKFQALRSRKLKFIGKCISIGIDNVIEKVTWHSIRIGEVDIDDCSVKHVKGGRYSIKLGDIDIVVKGKYKKR